MFEPALTTVLSQLAPGLPPDTLRVWGVFALCLICSAVGVGASFLIFGAAITGYRLWGLGLVLSVVMLGVSYGAKHSNADARGNFGPMDLIQFLSQGFLWPSTWPALADFAGIKPVGAPNLDSNTSLQLGFLFTAIC